MLNFNRLIKRIPQEIKYIFSLFLVTRLSLTIIGVISRLLLEPYRPKYYEQVYPKQLWLNIWVNWDSGWYLRIASFDWYSQIAGIDGRKGSFAFFPLYPLLIRSIGFILHNNVITAVLISNLALLIACIFLYKLVKFDFETDTALRSVRYLLLFPSAFIFSGVFNESLYLALILACFYYAKKNQFLCASLLGFFMSLTKPQGVIIIFPLLYIYLKNKEFSFSKIKVNIMYLILIPLGSILFIFYAYHLTGDWFKGAHVAAEIWGFKIHNPIRNIATGLLYTRDVNMLFPTYFSIIMFLILLISYKKVEFSYWLFGAMQFLLSFSYGPSATLNCLLRHILPIFVLYIIFARIKKDGYLDLFTTVSFALLQGFLMVFWCNGFSIII